MSRQRYTPKQLKELTARTVGHYQNRADDFWEGTRDHDVTQNINALLDPLQIPKGARILDFGCGPGRDIKAFQELGHVAIGLDGSEAFCAMARAYSGAEVWCQDFIALTLPRETFDGIFANASLFHIPRCELPRVLGELFDTLKTGGVLVASSPRGPNIEQMNAERYGAYLDHSVWASLFETACFRTLTHYFRPSGLPREQQPWLVTVWRK